MVADYTVEFVWIMAKYSASEFAHIETLLGTPTMRAHLARRRARVEEILNDWRFRIKESREAENSASAPIESSHSIESPKGVTGYSGC